MTDYLQNHADDLQKHFGDRIKSVTVALKEITLDVAPGQLLEVCTELRDHEGFQYEQLSDLCGVDYSQYGVDEWATEESSTSGFSRGVESSTMGRLMFGDELEAPTEPGTRFASVIHLISYAHNRRLRVRCFADDNEFPVLPSVTDIWNGVNWFERESFDLYGILYSGHPDLRRILTDYGFVGHPFRKDFPLVGHVEMRYDPEQKRVIYEPVSIEPRVLVPRVKREGHRYESGDEPAIDQAEGNE